MVTPATGEPGGRMPGGDVAEACEEASMNTPRAEGGDVRLTADVPDGSTVAPGDEILFRLTWDPAKWSGPDLDRALSCVRVKGGLAPELSEEEQPTANDGLFEYRLHVPDNIRPDCDVCAEGFVAGLAGDGSPQQLRSERHCFMSGPPTPTPPATRPPTPPVTSPPTPATTTPTTEPARLPTAVPPDVPTEVGGITAGPVPQPGTAVEPGAELPRTGTAASRAGTAGGGLALALGGLAVMGGSGRRKVRRTEG
jgi:hypothetical protein